VPYI
jgi:hypothetical protein